MENKDLITPTSFKPEVSVEGAWGLRPESFDAERFKFNRSIPESVFEKIFLPILYGEKESVEHNGRAYTMKDWVNEVGSVVGEMDIHKDSEPNNILFTVPSLYSTEIFDPVENAKVGFHLNHAELLKNINPKVGANERVRIVNDITSKLANSNTVVQMLEKWDTIFSRYGKERLFTSVNNYQGASSNVADSEPEFDIME